MPSLHLDLVESAEPANEFMRTVVSLSVSSPAENDVMSVRMTLHEADLLRRHLVQLLREVSNP